MGGRERGGGEVETKRGCEGGSSEGVRMWICRGEVECDKMFIFHAAVVYLCGILTCVSCLTFDWCVASSIPNMVVS